MWTQRIFSCLKDWPTKTPIIKSIVTHMPIKKGLEVRQLVMQFHQAGAKLLNFGQAPYEEQLGLPIQNSNAHVSSWHVNAADQKLLGFVAIDI